MSEDSELPTRMIKRVEGGVLNKIFIKLDLQKYVRGIIYGGTDGIITIFAVVAGVSGASLSIGILLILGIATLVSDALSMAVSDYLSSTAENDVKEEKEKELNKKYDKDPTILKEKLNKIFHSRKFAPTEVEILSSIISKDKKTTVDLILAEEESLQQEDPKMSALYTFLSFIFFGIIPLIADILMASFGNTLMASATEHTFLTACFFSFVTLFILGILKAKFTYKNPITIGLQMVAIGGMASVVAYTIAFALSGIDEVNSYDENGKVIKDLINKRMEG